MRAFFVLAFFSFTASAADIVFQTSQVENLRILKNNVLEVMVPLPTGTTLSIPENSLAEIHDYRQSNGQVERSSNGFYPDVQIMAVGSENERDFPKDRIAEINKSKNWMSVTALPVK